MTEVEMRDALDTAWGIIANAGGGDWMKETQEWRTAATEWRNRVLPNLARGRMFRDQGKLSAGDER